jgi:DNA-directed RNA polymerase specialized sigma subunit
VDTNKKERQYDAKYALDNPKGVRMLLDDYNALIERQYKGDYDAVVILADLATAINKAGLTDKQFAVLRLIYAEDLTQEKAGEWLGITKQTVNRCLKILDVKIARVYEYWARRNEGYSLHYTEEMEEFIS